MRYLVGLEVFSTKQDIQLAAQKLLKTYEHNQCLNDEDFDFMIDLLNWHPDATRKIGSGVSAIQIQRHGLYGTKGFTLIRNDGSTTDFSYKKCLLQPSHWQLVLRAARMAIEPQIFQVKKDAFADQKTTLCQITGEPLVFTQAHVDHVPPWTFDLLIRSFLTELEIDVGDIQFQPSRDNETRTFFLDPYLASNWKKFHADNAQLRVISDAANYQVAREYAK